MELKSNHEHKYKLLKDEARSDDSSENKTHENIADNLYKLITDAENDSDFNIGLEGSWGSGKSTIISILKNKFQNQQKIFYFYFDAWQHEGDPLRRIFLEELAKQLKEKVSKRSTEEEKKLEELSKRISNRQKTVTTKTTQSATALGIWLAITTFLVPLGIALLSSIKLDEIDFAIYLGHGWFLFVIFFGLVLCIAPVLVIVLYCIALVYCGFNEIQEQGWIEKFKGAFKNTSDTKRWSFLEKESSAESIQEISESEERSSIEFAKYFEEILDALKKNEYKKVLFIIDNLDRVDPLDSLKIWSTLQTFFQNRNPSNEEKNNEIQKYFIVPFDREGLRKLWDKKDETVAQSFFNKCFQLVISVPPLTHNAWEAFLNEKLKESLEDHREKALTLRQNKFKTEVIDVFKATRENAVDIPSYREIINFINQVNWLRASINKDISDTTIARFAVFKYLKFMSMEEIRESLLSDEEDSNFNLEEKKEIAGIIYGVSPEKGLEVLLGKEILRYWEENINDFENKSIQKIKSLEENFTNGFWTQLEVFLNGKKTPLSIVDLLKLAFLIKLEVIFDERSNSIQQWLLKKLEKREKENQFYISVENTFILEMYKRLFQLCCQHKNLIDYFFSVLAMPFKYQLLRDNHDESFSYFIKLFNELHSISQREEYEIKVPDLNLSLSSNNDPNNIILPWLNFTKEVFSNNSETEIYKYLLPPTSLISSLSENGYDTFETQYLPDLHYLLKYFFKSQEFRKNIQNSDWTPLMETLRYHAINNHSIDNNKNAESFYLALIELMKLGYDLTDFLTNNSTLFPNYVNHNKDLLKYPALLYLSINLPFDQTIRNIVPALRSFWEQDIRENKNPDLEFIFNNLEYIQNNNALWNLLQEDISRHKAVVAVISMVINPCNGKRYDNVLNDLKNQLKNLTLENWTEVFNKLLEDGLAACPIIEIALSLHDKDSTFTLTGDYKDTLLNFVERLLKRPATSWIAPIQRYQKLIYILDNEYRTEFKKATVPNILDNWNHLQSNVLDLFGDFIDFNELATNEVFKNRFKELLRDDSINPQQIDKFCTVYQSIYRPSRDSELEKLIKLRIEKIDNPQDKLRLRLTNISQKLGINLEGKEI